MKKIISLILIFYFILIFSSKAEIIYLNKFQLTGAKNFIHSYETLNIDGTYNAVVEIPSGTNEKWEVSKDGFNINLEFKNGLPRIINYLSYPGNYGFMPKTLLPADMGGDGDAIDVLILGPSVPRGSVVKIKILGMLEMLDNGEIDNKIIAALESSKISRIKSIKSLKIQYPGILEIIKIWFNNYKGVNMKINGFVSKKNAIKFINQSKIFYENR